MTTRPRFASPKRLAVLSAVGALASSLIVPLLASTASAAGAAAGALGPPNTWTGTGQMGVARSGQTATLLPSGKVLIAGGGTARAELYDPATRAFSPAGHLPAAVTDATATLLPSGKVLVAGGLVRSHQLKSAELYDPATGTWSATGSMNVARSGQTATLLPDGSVLVAGGGCNGHAYGCDAGSFETPLRSAEIYDPATGTWHLTGSMKFGRQFFTATALRNGDVLATGGFASCDDDFCSENNSAELYDPATGTWAATGSMKAAREQHTATLLGNGEVLVAGGLNEGGFNSGAFRYSSAELYNPAAGTWAATAPMAAKRAGHTATLLHNGWVLVAGGSTTAAEIYEPQRALWVSPGTMNTARTSHTATLLPGGHVLVTGGDGPDGQPLATAEEFLAGAGPLVTVTPASITFGGQQVGSASGFQSYHISNVGSAGLAASGLAVTGRNPGDYRATTDCTNAPVAPGGTCLVRVRFAPATTGLRTAVVGVSDNAPGSPHGTPVTGFGIGPNSWAPTAPMSLGREHFTATLLPSGKVLMAGGQTGVTQSLASAELYNPATRSFTATGSLSDARDNPAAVLLKTGQVLITGGLTSKFTALSSAELYNPAAGAWTRTTPMNAAGYALTTTLLPSGKVLVTGFGGSPAVAEVYDPAKATWTDTGPMKSAHGFATATLLNTGKVLVAGGGTAAAELYNPATNTWAATGSMIVARQAQTATLLPGGDVLAAGGVAPGGGSALASAELYDPATGKWTATASMTTSRYGATATLMPNGTVLVAGGCTGGCGNSPGLASAEIYTQGFFEPVASMTQPRVFGTATLLPNGTLLEAGGGTNYYNAGTATAEFYTTTLLSANPASGPAGQQVTVSGSGFFAGESVRLFWDGGTVLGHTATSASGAFSTKITVPSAATAGQHLITVQGRRSFAGATATFTVTG